MLCPLGCGQEIDSFIDFDGMDHYEKCTNAYVLCQICEKENLLRKE